MLDNETPNSSPPLLIVSLAISVAVFLIIGIWKTRSGGLRNPTRVLYPVDCMADLMSELAEHKEILGREMEKKIQVAEMKRIKALTDSMKKAQEVTKKTNQMKKLEEERNQAREDARQRRRDIEWLFSKRKGVQIALAPELRWPSFPEIPASSSTRANPKLPAGSPTECLAGPSSSVQNTCGNVAQGDSPEMPTPSFPPPRPNHAEGAVLVSSSGSPLSSTNTNSSKTPSASITHHHKDHSKKPLKGNPPTNALKGTSIPSPPVLPRGSRNGTSAVAVPKDSATRLNSKQTPVPGKKL